MKIYTKRGDLGETDLFGGERVLKSHPRVLAYGAVDHANSVLGFAYALETLPLPVKEHLKGLMGDLFAIGAELATADKPSAHAKLATHLKTRINETRIMQLENWIDEAQEQLPPLQAFILPTGCEAASRLHLARTAVRQAEQAMVGLMQTQTSLRSEIVKFMNRLSDLLFVWARLCNHLAHVEDVKWEG